MMIPQSDALATPGPSAGSGRGLFFSSAGTGSETVITKRGHEVLREHNKPDINNTRLVTLAMKNSPTGHVVIGDVYNFARRYFQYYDTLWQIGEDEWKRCIRHTISWNATTKNTTNYFVKIFLPNKKVGGRQRYAYALAPEKAKYLIEKAQNWCRKQRQQIQSVMKQPELFESVFL